MGKSITYLLIVFIFICGCTNKNKESIEKKGTEIVCQFEFDELPVFNLIDTIEFVCLEMTDESMIGNIKKIIHRNNLYYVWDNLQQKVFIFDHQGKYIDCVGNRGQGSCEYDDIYDLHVNETGDVEILGQTTPANIITYSLNNSCVTQKFNELSIDRFTKYNGEYIFYQNGGSDIKEQQYSLFHTDSLGNILSRWLPTHKYVGYTIGNFTSFQTYNDTILFHKPQDYNIYQIVPGEDISVRYTINVGEYTMPETVKQLYLDDFEAYHRESSNYVQGVDYFFETQNTLHFSAINKSPGFRYHNIYFKETKETIVLNHKDAVAMALLNPIEVEGDTFISYINPAYLMFEEIPTNKKYLSDKYPPLTELFDSIESDMNPIIIRYKYKTKLFNK